MRALVAILGASRGAFRGSLAGRAVVVLATATLAGALAGLTPAVIGLSMTRVLGGTTREVSGALGAVAPLVLEASPRAALAVALAATLMAVAGTVLGSRLGSQLAGELTAALRVAMLRAVLHTSPRDVEAAGAGMTGAHDDPPPGATTSAGAPRNAPRGIEVVKLSIAREAAVVADFAVAVGTGLPGALAALLVLAWDVVAQGTGLVFAGAAGLFVLSRVASDRAARRVSREMARLRGADAELFASLGESLAATEDLRLLGARGQAVREFAAAAHRAADARARMAGALAVSGQIRAGFTAAAPVVILVALLLADRPVDAGGAAKLLLVAPLVLARLESLDALRAGLVEREEVVKTIAALLALPPSPMSRPEPLRVEPASIRGALRFEELVFTPAGAARPVIDGLTLDVPAGATVGLCGASGCGKTTLLRLLLRLEEPTSGRILLDGRDLADLDPFELPRIFGVLGQTTRLFERSLRENLVLGLAPPPSDAALLSALAAVQLDALAREEGDRGLSTPYRAVPPSLSGGEARRVMLARLLVRDPPVLVLDEPEAGLPGATAEQLLGSVARLAAGRTCLVATHAPHVLPATFLVVLDRGRVAARGPHHELASSSEAYRALLAAALRERPAVAGDPRAAG